MRHPHQSSPQPRRRALPFALALLAVTAIAAAVALAGSPAPVARAATRSGLQQRIASGRSRVSSLSGAVASETRRVNQLNTAVAAISHRLAGLQSDLTAKLHELYALRAQLTAAQARLKRLEATEAVDEQVLAQQLVGSYEGGQPDLVEVVLEASGFNDLLNRLNFVQRVGHQDTRVAASVRAARIAVAAQAVKLGRLSQRQQQLADQVLSERNSVGQTRVTLVSERLTVARARAHQTGQLVSARAQVASLTSQLNALEAAQRAAAARAAAQRAAAQRAASQQAAASTPSPSSASGAGGGGGGAPAPAPAPSAPSGSGFVFPMPKGSASPPSTWSLDDGVDISAPGGTPEYAVCSGTVVLHGIGGFGPSAPVLHCDSPLAGYDYVYYGHAGPGNWVPVGTHVSQGQVISEVGYGIVGISSGPHLEIGFADASGAPVGPGSAPAMMSLLQGSY